MATREVYGATLGVREAVRERGVRGALGAAAETVREEPLAAARRCWSVSAAYVLLLPTLVISAVFLYYPAIRAAELSLYQTLFFGAQRTYVGAANYASLATSSSYHRSVAITVLFAAIVVVAVMTIALFVSYLLHEVSWGEGGYLIAAIWPYALPPAVAGIVFLFLAHPTIGMFTAVVESLTSIDVNWFSRGRQAFVVVTVAAVWKQIGYNVIFMLAAMNNVPKALAEAAEIDGVGRWTQLLRLYVPLISPTLVFLVVMNTVYAFFGTFAFVDLMTKGGPGGATNIMIFDLYRNAFEFNNNGLASAQSVVLFVIVSALMYVQLRVTGERVHYS